MFQTWVLCFAPSNQDTFSQENRGNVLMSSICHHQDTWKFLANAEIARKLTSRHSNVGKDEKLHSVLEFPRPFLQMGFRGRTQMWISRLKRPHKKNLSIKNKGELYTIFQFSLGPLTRPNSSNGSRSSNYKIKQNNMWISWLFIIPWLFFFLKKILQSISFLISTYFYPDKASWLTKICLADCRLKKWGSMLFLKTLILLALLTLQEHWETSGLSHYEFVSASSNLT